MQKVIGNEFHNWHDSFEELERALRDGPTVNTVKQAETLNGSYALSHVPDWLGGLNGGAEVARKLAHGWHDNLTKVRVVGDRMETALRLDTATPVLTYQRRRKRQEGDYGDTLHMTRVWAGQLDKAWERPVRKPRLTHTQRYMTVLVDMCAAARQNAADGVYRAAVAMKVCDVFSRLGYATEIWIGDSGLNPYIDGPTLQWNAVRVKQYDQPLNEDRLATMTSMAFYRTYMLAHICNAPYKTAHGLGRPHNAGLVLPLRERAAIGERVIRIGECWNENAALSHLKSVINKEVEVTEPVSVYA